MDIDASRMCNEMRFINNSSDPNVEPRRLVVNGETRIGFFAVKDIEPQSELVFNYGSHFILEEPNQKRKASDVGATASVQKKSATNVKRS